MITNRFQASELSKQQFCDAIERDGYAIVESVFDDNFINALTIDLLDGIEKESSFKGTKTYQEYAMLLACPIYGGTFLDVPENRVFMQPFEWILDETCIIWVYTSSSMPPGSSNYASRIHVDRPHFIPGFTEAMGSLILLSDFTDQNGATYFLPGSHLNPTQPEEKDFYDRAERVIAPKGSVFYFHLRLWHSGGFNQSDEWRHSLGIGMIRPYMKQRIDLPRAMSHLDLSNVSETALQKLGFFSQPPTSIEEYYENAKVNTKRQRSEWESNEIE